MGERVVTVSARIPRSQLREVEKLAEARGMDKSSIVRALLDMGIREERMRQALEMIREGKATVWRASEIAGLDYREMLAALRTHNVPFPLSVQDMELELKEITRRK